MLLESMFRGNFAPMELVYPDDPEYEKANQKVCELIEQLKNHLMIQDKKVLDDLLKEVYTAQAIESESYFCFAFAAGMQLQREVQEKIQSLENQ